MGKNSHERSLAAQDLWFEKVLGPRPLNNYVTEPSHFEFAK